MIRFTRRRLALLGLLLLGLLALWLWRTVLPHRPSAAERADVAALNAWMLHQWDGVAALSGRVVTPTGSPAAGATVTLVAQRPNGTFAAPRSTKTDAQGRFRFEGIQGLLAGCSDPPVALAQAPGWGLSFATFAVSEAEAVVILRHATDLHLSFLDPYGRPARGLPVRVVALFTRETSDFLPLPPHLQPQFLTTTDPQGEAVFPGLPVGTEASLKIEDARYAALTPEQRHVYLHWSPRVEVDPIQLAFGATISGRVIYRDTGRPAAGVKVGISSPRELPQTTTSGGVGFSEVTSFPEAEWDEPRERGVVEVVTDAQAGTPLPVWRPASIASR